MDKSVKKTVDGVKRKIGEVCRRFEKKYGCLTMTDIYAKKNDGSVYAEIWCWGCPLTETTLAELDGMIVKRRGFSGDSKVVLSKKHIYGSYRYSAV